MKKHRVNRIMTFILVLALSVSTLLTGCGKNNDKIVLGWIGPLTGEMTIWGTAEMQALTMAVEDTNAAGGLLGKEVLYPFKGLQVRRKIKRIIVGLLQLEFKARP